MREALSGLTVRGRAFVAAGVTAIVCAIVLGQPSLSRVGVLVLALPLVSAFFIGRSRYRLALVRSLVVMPRVLLLDEPTASLDAASVRAVEALLRSRLEAGLAVLLVTHAQERARRMGERVFEMIEGVLHPR